MTFFHTSRRAALIILLLASTTCIAASSIGSLTAVSISTPSGAISDGQEVRGILAPHLPWAGNASRTANPHATWTASATGPDSSATATLNVTVGQEGKLVFSPSSLNAPIGTVITFNFLSLNHTLTQSTLQHPCTSNGGFDSSFAQFNPINVSGKFLVQYQVTRKDPQWFSCAQTSNRAHCQAGMVFSLNPQGMHSRFLANALAAVTRLSSALPESSTLACTPTSHPTASNSVFLGNATGSTRASPPIITPTISNIGNTAKPRHGLLWGFMIALILYITLDN